MFSLLERADSVVLADMSDGEYATLPGEVLRWECLEQFGAADVFSVTVSVGGSVVSSFKTSRSNVYRLFFADSSISEWFLADDAGLIALSFERHGDRIDVSLCDVAGL